jgi:hypothetical protein
MPTDRSVRFKLSAGNRQLTTKDHAMKRKQKRKATTPPKLKVLTENEKKATTGGFSLIISRYFQSTISTGTMLRNHNETLVEDAE